MLAAAVSGTFVARKNITVEPFCEGYINGRHDLKATALSKLRYDLTPFTQKFGSVALQRVTKADVDALIRDLTAGGSKTPKGRLRRPWGAVAVNKVIQAVTAFAAAQAEGLISRNPARPSSL